MKWASGPLNSDCTARIELTHRHLVEFAIRLGAGAISVFGRALPSDGCHHDSPPRSDSKSQAPNSIRQAAGGGGSGAGNTGKVIGGRPGISITGGPGVSDVVAGAGAGGGGVVVVGDVLAAGEVLEAVVGDGLAV